MSVGGKVIDVVRMPERIWINTNDGYSKCAIYVERDENSEQVTKGDIVWWQGRKAYWTTADRTTHVETVLHRIGYSGVKSNHLQSVTRAEEVGGGEQ